MEVAVLARMVMFMVVVMVPVLVLVLMFVLVRENLDFFAVRGDTESAYYSVR